MKEWFTDNRGVCFMPCFLKEENLLWGKEYSKSTSKRVVSIGNGWNGAYVLSVPCNWNSLFSYSSASARLEYLDGGNALCIRESFFFIEQGEVDFFHSRDFLYGGKGLELNHFAYR